MQKSKPGRMIEIRVNGALLGSIDTSKAVAADYICFMQTVSESLMHIESLEREANASGKTIKHATFSTLGSIQITEAGKMITTLHVDASAVAGQTRVVEAVSKRYAPLIEKIPRERVEVIVSNLIVELRALIFSYNVTTTAADGTSKTVRTLRYRGDIKDFTTTFLARELHLVHS